MKEEVCETCGGQITPDKVTLKRWYAGEPVIIEDVPVGICQFCGERYYEADTIDKLNLIAQESEEAKVSFADSMSCSKNEEERKELTQAELTELWKESLIKEMKDCLTSYGAIQLKEGNSISLKEVRKEMNKEIDKQLAGVDTEDFSKEEIEALSEIGLYKEAYRLSKKEEKNS